MIGNGETLSDRASKRAGALPGNAGRQLPAQSRVIPHSEEAEKGLLSSMMQDRAAMSRCIDRLHLDHFYVAGNQLVFAVLMEFYKTNKVIELIGLTQELADGIPVSHVPESYHRGLLKRGEKWVINLDIVGGASYVTELFTFVPTAANVEYYLEIVRDKYLAREIIAKCTELVRVAYDEQTQISEVLEQTQATLTEIIIDSERADVFRHVREGVEVAMDQLDHAYHHRGQAAINGLATGIIDFDRMTAGLRGQQLVIVGARPSQGKTALAMNFAANMAVKNKVPVGVFSMEMSFQEIVNRLVCSVSGMKLQRFRDGFLSKEDFEKVPEKFTKVMESPLWIDETPALSLPSFKARARLMKMRFGVQVIVVDYLQLMRSPTKRAMDARWLEITEISGTLKAVAKELNIPVVCCAQLNREAESRSEFCKPRLSDLRESGSIEQDADIVALLWRPERHIEHPKTQNKKAAKMLGLKDEDGIELWGDEKDLEPHQVIERDRQLKEYAALIVAKQRNGPVGDVRLRFIGEETRFYNMTEKMWSNNPAERQATKEDE